MRFIISFFFLLFFFHPCSGQPTSYSSFTVNDGLPSNFVYGSIEDNHGFLWIATDAGIARFDGKYFQVFTTRQGLPDNEVLSVVKEKNGRLWVNCFKRSPAYFDEIQNRFINSTEDTTLARVTGTGVMSLYVLPDGGVMFYTEKGSYVFKDKKILVLTSKPGSANFLIKENSDGSQLTFGLTLPVIYSAYKNNPIKIYHTTSSRYLDSAITTTMASDYHKAAIDDGKFYLFNYKKNKCYIYSAFTFSPLRFKVDSISITEQFTNFNFTSSCLNLYCNSGNTYVLDKNTLQLLFVNKGNYATNSLYNDSKGNVWVSTIDRGLLLYKKNNSIINLKMPEKFDHNNFLSIARKTDGGILAGNYHGEIFENHGQLSSIRSIQGRVNSIAKQRKIIQSQNKVFTFSEDGVYCNYNRRVISYGVGHIVTAKTAINNNDSIIIVGTLGYLFKLNSRTEVAEMLFATSKRITALAKLNDSVVYYGSTDGLYKYDLIHAKSKALSQSNLLFSNRVVALCTTDDNLIWMATPDHGLLAIKDDKLVLQIKESEEMNFTARSITSAGKGQVWLGSSAGISIVNYQLHNNSLTYKLQHISVTDGLASNVVNEMLYNNDTVYAATANGISVIPANISIPVFSIPVRLIYAAINQRDTVLTDSYDLRYDQQNVLLRFAGIELNGHFKNLQYTLDKNTSWNNLSENTLNLQLNYGDHILQVRAVDINGNISTKMLTIYINIATPFWKAVWFWVVIVLVIQLLIGYLLMYQYKKRKAIKLAKEIAGVQTASLEQQAFTSLMNPHFMFNALNSIQHYINVQDRQNANRYLTDFASLIRKNFEAAQQSFIPLEQELANIKIYLRLEQMRFTNRFDYTITNDETIDLDNWMMPTMMLQPLLENALLHGIMPSAIKGELEIHIEEVKKDLLITITDNGIGIESSRALKLNELHKSRGTELIQKRIAALSHFVKQPVTIDMFPAFEDDKNPGNCVRIFIPTDLYEAWLKAQKH